MNETNLKKLQKKAMKRRSKNYIKENKKKKTNTDGDNGSDEDEEEKEEEDEGEAEEIFLRPCPLISTAAVHIGRYFLLFGGFNNRLRERSEIWVKIVIKKFCIWSLYIHIPLSLSLTLTLFFSSFFFFSSFIFSLFLFFSFQLSFFLCSCWI